MWGWIIDFIVCTHLDILSSTARKHGGWCPYPWILAGDGWEVGGAGGWYRGAELAGVLAVPLFNRGSSARRRQCTWRPAWSPRMWAWSETRAAGSHNDQCHATRKCRNTSLPGRKPSRRSLQQQGLRADKERGILFSVGYADDLGQSYKNCFQGPKQMNLIARNSYRSHICQKKVHVHHEHIIVHIIRGGK